MSVKKVVAEVVKEALTLFGGSRVSEVSPGAYCDELLWASICWRIGYTSFIDAIYCCSKEISRSTRFFTKRERTRYFQAYLNRHFPKGGAR